MKDGREFSEFTDSPKGDPVLNPMTRDEILEKFRANVSFSGTISEKKAEQVLALLAKLEKLDSVDTMVELLVS